MKLPHVTILPIIPISMNMSMSLAEIQDSLAGSKSIKIMLILQHCFSTSLYYD